MTKELEKKAEFKLPNEVVKIKFTGRATSDIKDPKHDLYQLATRAKVSFVVPLGKNKVPIQPLTEEEIRAYEENNWCGISKGDLNPFKPFKPGDKSFNWATFRVSFSREQLDTDGFKLRLSDPYEYLQYKVLLANAKSGAAHDLIAPSWAERNDKPYKWAIVKENEETRESIASANDVVMAMKKLSEFMNTPLTQRYILRAYLKGNATIAFSASSEFMLGELTKIATKDPVNLMKVMDDPDAIMKGFILSAVDSKLIKKVKANTYILKEPEASDFDALVEYTLSDLVKFLDPDGPNQKWYADIRSKLEAKIKNK